MTNESPALYWSNFKENYLDSDAPAVIRILEEPRTEIITQPDQTRVSLRVYTDEAPVVVPAPRAIEARYLSSKGQKYFEVSTSVQQLHHPFFFLMLAIRDRLSSDSTTASGALAHALGEYRRLLSTGDLLSADSLLGLFGELWTLKALMARNGPIFVDSWLGPVPVVHDFRYGSIELEVKTTRANTRAHHINGASQLVPSIGCELYLISIQAQETGPRAGSSVPELIDEIAARLIAHPSYRVKFEHRLNDVGYEEEHRPHYGTRFILRTNPIVIRIDDAFPRITLDHISSIDPRLPARISALEYILDVSGLGIECGTPASQRLVEF